MNLFGIGFPITLGIGFMMLTIALPYMATPLAHLFQEGIVEINRITKADLPLGGNTAL